MTSPSPTRSETWAKKWSRMASPLNKLEEQKWRELSTKSGDVFQLVCVSSVQGPCSFVWTENVKLFFEFLFFRDRDCYIKQ